MRCFETVEREFPDFVTSFIVHGAPDLIMPTAERLFAGHLAERAKPCGRVHKTGPLLVHSLLMPESPGKEIDWLEVARRLEDEKPRRSLEAGACLFRELLEQRFVTVEHEGPIVTVDFDAKIDRELLERIQESSPSPAPVPQHAPKFLFVGSRYEDDRAQRVGNVLLVEASSLDEAADICSAALGMAQKECILVEWCCPLHGASP